MDIQKEELLEIFRQRKGKTAKMTLSPDDIREGDVFVILHKKEVELIMELLYDALADKSVNKHHKKTALQAIKHIGGE